MCVCHGGGIVFFGTAATKRLGSFPGYLVNFKKSGLESTVCACAAYRGILETTVTLVRIALRNIRTLLNHTFVHKQWKLLQVFRLNRPRYVNLD